MITNPCLEIHTSAEDRPSVPSWFAEVVIIARHLAEKGQIEAFGHQVRLVRGRFGNYEPIDFLALLIGLLASACSRVYPADEVKLVAHRVGEGN